MARTILLASPSSAAAAARLAAAADETIDAVVTTPSAGARAAARAAAGGHWAFTIDEPLLARCAPGESGGDVLSRVAQALRGVYALDAHVVLVVCDGLDVLGAGLFVLDEGGVLAAADALERLVPLP